MRFARPAVLAALALMTAACGAPQLPGAASARIATGASVRGFDLAAAIEKILDRAEGGEPEAVEQAIASLRALAGGLTMRGSADFADVAQVWKAQRQLVHFAAKPGGEGWLTLAYSARVEADRTGQTLAKFSKMLSTTLRHKQQAGSPGQKPGDKEKGPQLAIEEILIAVEAAGDAMLDRFPELTPAMQAKIKGGTKPDDRHVYLALGSMLIAEQAKLIRTQAEADAFVEALDKIVAKAVADPQIGKEFVANLATWAAKYHALAPRGAQAIAESAISL